MYWNDDDHADEVRAPDDIVDIRFEIDCRLIPVDHAHALADALRGVLPWIAEEPSLAIHTVHVAGSQNGWERPTHGTSSCLMVSRRTKLTIRAPRHRVDTLLDILPGTRLDLDGYALTIGPGKLKALSTETTLFARYVALDLTDNADETAFLAAAAAALGKLDIRVRKALCGIPHPVATPAGAIPTRSLMLAGLTLPESIRLQQQGLGSHRLLGCGIFIPHKGIDPIKSPTE
ncbi:MAG: type I-MYXAN CRISPR-associated protein Cas6/Cmx6 [Sphingobacteriia bacterium]|nr:type I-MYXAN CRISPR-associated protein Cas6/Cmx6 [Sphingobacteriia bacterium]NCC37830.1 type I-MYXAN CRISPR-associated protein Cas6/Cmx6 [Gammaproteobacteria bacterium]